MVDKADSGLMPTLTSLEYVTPEEMAELERRSAANGVGPKDLMENAGRAVAEFVESRYPRAGRVCVVCGSGNNGGDGFVAARYLAASFDVSLVLLATPDRIRTEEARSNWERLAGSGVELHTCPDVGALEAVAGLIERSDVLVDAILGTGVSGGALREPLATAVRMVNESGAPKVAVDIPSGLDPGTGVPAKPTVVADFTVALHLPKVGFKGNGGYTGEVVVAPIGVIADAPLGVRVFQIGVGPMQNFAYLVIDEGSREGMVIDSGWEIEPIVAVAKENGIKVKYVCATHGHFDHVKTIGALADALGAKTVSHEESPLASDVRVKDGDVLALGQTRVRVVHTPGHTIDSVCYYDGKDLFTGDTLFIGAWGRTDLPGGSAATLFESLHDKIMSLPRETLIYPGHDYGDVRFRSLGEESARNPALLARTRREFEGLSQD